MTTPPAEQAELPELPRPTVRWLHVCEVAAQDFALATRLLDFVSKVPNLPVGVADSLTRAYEPFVRVVMQEIGRRAWDEAGDAASRDFDRIVQAARQRAALDAAMPHEETT